MAPQVSDCGKDVLMKRSVIEIGLLRPGGTAEAAKINRHRAEAAANKDSRLIAPTLLLKSAAMGEDNRARTRSGDLSADLTAVSSGENDFFLRGNRRSCQNDYGQSGKAPHGRIVTDRASRRCSYWLRSDLLSFDTSTFLSIQSNISIGPAPMRTARLRWATAT